MSLDARTLVFLPLGAGALAIGHRPPLRTLKRLREAGLSHVATALSEAENAHAIGAAAAHAKLGWIWIPIGSTKNLAGVSRATIAAALQTLTEALDAGGRVYLHCSAGIHRTGMIAAALLFHLGHDEAAVRAGLERLRPVTAEGVGEDRIDWARGFSAAS